MIKNIIQLKNKWIKGLISEYLIIFCYILRFYKVVTHRMRNFAGEIDLIVTKGNQIIFVEVKYRKQGIEWLYISDKQKKRIIRAAQLFISQNECYHHYEVRFDIAVVVPFKRPYIFYNVWNAFN